MWGKIFSAALMLGFWGFAAPTEAAKKPRLSGLELQQIQSRDFEVGKEVSFPAVMSVLQDEGYRIGSADVETGLITGAASTNSKTTWVPFVGFGKSKKTPVVSAYIENRAKGLSRVRLNFVMTKISSNQFGGNNDEEPIEDVAVYRDAFEKIDKAIFIRQSLDGPASVLPENSQRAEQAAQAPAPAGQ